MQRHFLRDSIVCFFSSVNTSVFDSIYCKFPCSILFYVWFSLVQTNGNCLFCCYCFFFLVSVQRQVYLTPVSKWRLNFYLNVLTLSLSSSDFQTILYAKLLVHHRPTFHTISLHQDWMSCWNQYTTTNWKWQKKTHIESREKKIILRLFFSFFLSFFCTH